MFGLQHHVATRSADPCRKDPTSLFRPRHGTLMASDNSALPTPPHPLLFWGGGGGGVGCNSWTLNSAPNLPHGMLTYDISMTHTDGSFQSYRDRRQPYRRLDLAAGCYCLQSTRPGNSLRQSIHKRPTTAATATSTAWRTAARSCSCNYCSFSDSASTWNQRFFQLLYETLSRRRLVISLDHRAWVMLLLLLSCPFP